MKKFLFLVGVILLPSLCNVLLAQDVAKELSLELLFKSRTLRQKGVYGMLPSKNPENYYKLEKDTLFIYSYKTNKKVGNLFVTNKFVTTKGDTLAMEDFEFSADESKILISTETEPIYRHSVKSTYYVYDLSAQKLTPLSDGGKQRLAEFSPDASKVAFVRDNNLFIKDLASNKESQITTDGLDRNVINGTTDWVYEEEFSFTKAFFWSPDGSKIAYYRMDESKVKEFSMTMFEELYPTEYKYKYPKAGEDNSVVNIMVYNLASASVSKMDIGAETDIYIPRIKWTGLPDKLAIMRMNRLQNKLEILVAEAGSGKSEVVYTETDNAYIEITDDWHYMPDGKQFLLMSQKNGYNHIYLLPTLGGTGNQLTDGQWEVDHIIGWDGISKQVYFEAAYSSPMNREVCAVDLKGRMKVLAGRAGSNRAEFGKGFKYFLKTWSDINTPTIYSICDSKGKELHVLEDNAAYLGKAKEYGLLDRELFQFTTSQGVTLNGWMIKPDNYSPEKKYPVLVYLYGGPGSQTVLNAWGRGEHWYQMLAQKGIMVVSVDNRGTGFRGAAFKKITYGELGKYETEDQIELAKHLINKGMADPKKIGIFGWSYGGYMSSLCVTKGAEYYSLGIAVAPVTNWRYYDNIYTERYMGLPKDNAKGYDDNSPINHVDKLKGKYLLVHGTADDNVHFQNSTEMVKALVDANKQFETMYYPNSNHGIYTGKNTTYHLYTRMTNFLLENLLK
jgi:dipeptidyl-peptidase-4